MKYTESYDEKKIGMIIVFAGMPYVATGTKWLSPFLQGVSHFHHEL